MENVLQKLLAQGEIASSITWDECHPFKHTKVEKEKKEEFLFYMSVTQFYLWGTFSLFLEKLLFQIIHYNLASTHTCLRQIQTLNIISDNSKERCQEQ